VRKLANTHGPLIAARNVMGTSGVEIRRAAFTTADCHDTKEENNEDNCHSNDIISDVTEKVCILDIVCAAFCNFIIVR